MSAEVHHYFLGDIGTQWDWKLVRREVEYKWTEGSKKKPSTREESLLKEETIDVPNIRDCAFLINVYGREQTTAMIRIDGQSYGGWSLSPAEYERIKRLIELHPVVVEFKKLASYL